jgi:hypothetical protein
MAPTWTAQSLTARCCTTIEKIVPEGEEVREFAWDRMKILNPETPLSGEKQMAEYWDKLQSLSPTPAAYEEKLAEQWRLIGCSTDGAPYVLTGLIRTMGWAYSPFSADSVQVRRLAADFLKDDCARRPRALRGCEGKPKATARLRPSSARVYVLMNPQRGLCRIIPNSSRVRPLAFM